MTRILDNRSLVGIDPTPRGLAFVFFERGELLDWGTWRDDGRELGLLDRLLDGCAADVLVLEDPAGPLCQRRPRMRQLLRVMARHGRARGLEVRMVAREDVRREWAAQGLRRKDAIASQVAKRFPELAPLVPRPRKSYRSEEARAQIFDAVSLVLHACSVSDKLSRVPQGA
jgi:hypothetical protein